MRLWPAKEGSGGWIGDSRAKLERQSLWSAARVAAGKKTVCSKLEGQYRDGSKKRGQKLLAKRIESQNETMAKMQLNLNKIIK